MRISQVIKRQIDYEGFRPVAYKDTEGVWTIGYGATTHRGRPVNSFTPMVSRAEALVSLKASVLDAIIMCHIIYPNWKELTDVQKEVLTHMAFQMGNRLRKFKLMNKAIAVLDMENWVAEMIDSDWYRKYPRVALPLVDAIRKDKWMDKAA